MIPGWTELVEPYKADARFHYSLWLSAGKPRHGDLFWNMCKSRNQFKFAKRRCVNAAEAIKKDRFVQACLDGGENVFSELKKLKKTPNFTSAKVDGHTDENSIADHFKNIYTELYNRTGSDQPLQDLLTEDDDRCTQSDLDMVNKITPSLVQKFLKEKINSGKTDSDADMTTDSLKNAPPELSLHISNFLRACFIHGYISPSLLVCAIILLVKNKSKPLDDSNNYRGISLGSLVLKIID